MRNALWNTPNLTHIKLDRPVFLCRLSVSCVCVCRCIWAFHEHLQLHITTGLCADPRVKRERERRECLILSSVDIKSSRSIVDKACFDFTFSALACYWRLAKHFDAFDNELSAWFALLCLFFSRLTLCMCKLGFKTSNCWLYANFIRMTLAYSGFRLVLTPSLEVASLFPAGIRGHTSPPSA